MKSGGDKPDATCTTMLADLDLRLRRPRQRSGLARDQCEANMEKAMPEGLIVVASAHGPGETMQKLMTALGEKGLAVLAHVDHAGAAARAGLELRPTDLLVFGKPEGGTPLMQAQQTMGIDLPLKALVWQDQDGKTWLGYNDPAWLAKRHGVENDKVVTAMREMLAALAAMVTT
jgi:uncharacterized protein (DUF302 family)